MADEQEEIISETDSDLAPESSEDDDDIIAALEAEIAALKLDNEQLRTELGELRDGHTEHASRIGALEAGVGGYAGVGHTHEGYAAGDHSHEAPEIIEESAPRPGGGVLARVWYKPIRG